MTDMATILDGYIEANASLGRVLAGATVALKLTERDAKVRPFLEALREEAETALKLNGEYDEHS